MTEYYISDLSCRSRLARLLASALLLELLLPLSLPGQNDSGTVKAGTLANVHTDKRVVQSARWLLAREFTVDFAVKNSEVSCGEITTTDATEAHDLINSKGQQVEVVEKGKDLYLKLQSGRHIRARRLSTEKCPV